MRPPSFAPQRGGGGGGTGGSAPACSPRPAGRAASTRAGGRPTDESRPHGDVAGTAAERQAVRRSAGEYVRGEARTNSGEGPLPVFRRGMKGIYQRREARRRHRRLAEFDFRHSHRIAVGVDDFVRAGAAPLGVVGKGLSCRAAH